MDRCGREPAISKKVTRFMKRMCGPFSLLWVFSAASSGCGGPGSGGAGEELSAQDILQGVRAAHGASRWNAAAGVRFSYRLSVPGKGEASLPEVAFRSSDLLHLWVAPGADKTPLRLRLDAPPGALADALAAAGVLGPDDPGELRSTLDHSLRSIRYFLSLPLTTLRGRWEFRGLTAPPGIPRPSVLEVFPMEPGVPFTRCWMVRDARTGLLARVLYEVPPQVLSGGSYEIAFARYEDMAGIAVARSRRHVPVESKSPGGARRDPFFRVESEGPQGRLAFEEEVLHMAFLSTGDVDARCPLPPEKAAPKGSAPEEPEGPAR